MQENHRNGQDDSGMAETTGTFHNHASCI